MTQKQSTLYFHAGKLKFSAGHFTIFSETQREPLHGHNYTLDVTMTAAIHEPGIISDYRLLEERLVVLCQQLNWHTLIPQGSPYLKIEADDEHYQITFNQKSMWLLKSDVILLPLENITLETLSQWFVDQVMQDKQFVDTHNITSLTVKVSNGPYHAADACCRLV